MFLQGKNFMLKMTIMGLGSRKLSPRRSKIWEAEADSYVFLTRFLTPFLILFLILFFEIFFRIEVG